MKDLKVWQFILEKYQQQKAVVFLCVMESSGSSPGRQGFKMAVSDDEMCGSVGGGIMEHKFVELAKEMLQKQSEQSLLKKQIHSKQSPVDQSGMICSGEQTLVVYPIKSGDIEAIQKIENAILNNSSAGFEFTSRGIFFISDTIFSQQYSFEKKSETDWQYSEKLYFANHLLIIGGGHVSLALSRLMYDLNFHITVYDDRKELNTWQQNEFAHQKKLIEYENIQALIPENDNQFVVIMTFGYRSDGLVLRQFIKQKYKYLGLLGSKTKVEKMLNELCNEGIEESKIKALHAPIGVQIKSQTPEEIAVSIAAEIILVKNANS